MKILNRTDLSLVKFVAVFVMIITHCRFFYSLYYNFEGEIKSNPDFFTQLMMMTGLISLCIPLIAGQELYERVQKYLVGGRLRNFPSAQFFSLLLIVAFLDPLKSILAEGLIYSFRWNALPLISFSLFLILEINKRLAVNWIFIFTPLILIASYFLTPLAQSFASLSPRDYSLLLSSSVKDAVLIVFYLFLFAAFMKIKGNLILFKGKAASVILWFCFLLLLSNVYWAWQVSPSFVVSLKNLPLGSLAYLGKNGGHIWPVFPWASLVFFGYWFQWSQHKARSKETLHLAFASLSFVWLVCSFQYFFANYVKLLDPKSGYSSAVFSLPVQFFPTVFALYTMVFYLLKFFASESMIKNPFMKMISSGILIVYVVHYILAAKLAPVISMKVHGVSGYGLYVFLVYLLTIGFSGLMVYLYQNPIRFVVRKSSGE